VHEEKRRRLEAKGWKVGSAREFLGLTDEEAAYIDIKLRLAASLRERRQHRGLSQAELARLLKSSQSRVAKMEAGDSSVSLDLLIRSLLALGMSNRDVSRIISARSPAPAA
jgi:ribosome-binding protein aMBF1 (putative translation factor)